MLVEFGNLFNVTLSVGFFLGSLLLPPSLRRNISDFHRIWALRAKAPFSGKSSNLDQQS